MTFTYYRSLCAERVRVSRTYTWTQYCIRYIGLTVLTLSWNLYIKPIASDKRLKLTFLITFLTFSIFSLSKLLHLCCVTLWCPTAVRLDWAGKWSTITMTTRWVCPSPVHFWLVDDGEILLHQDGRPLVNVVSNNRWQSASGVCGQRSIHVLVRCSTISGTGRLA